MTKMSQNRAWHGKAAARPLNILLVDDSELILMVLKEFFKANGHNVITADCGTSAIGALIRGEIDVVISDYHMPGMDGLELLKTMRSIGSRVPFLLMTGTAPEDCKDKSLEMGANGFIRKPIDFDEILASVSSVVPPGQPK